MTEPVGRTAASADPVSDVVNILATLTGVDPTNPDWWKTFFAELLALAAFIGGLFHPGFHVTGAVQAAVPSAAVAAVAIIGIVRLFTTASVKKTAISAAATVHLRSMEINAQRESEDKELALRTPSNA